MNTNISYNFINTVRTRLLLFIDKEIRANKLNNLRLIPNTPSEFSHRIQFEETFSQNRKDGINFSSVKNWQSNVNIYKSQEKYIENYQNKIVNNNMKRKYDTHKASKINIFNDNIYPKTNTAKNNINYLKPILECSNKNNNLSSSIIIDFKGKVYSIKSTKKISSTINISNKSKKGEKYLKRLCESLKIMKPKQIAKKSGAGFYLHLSKSREKLIRVASPSRFFNQHGKNKGRAISTVKNFGSIQRIKAKINKIKPFQTKSIKKYSSNTNTINILPKK